MLERIAAALNIPAEVFARSSKSHGDPARVLTENAEALTIFAGLTDHDARQRSLAYLRRIAEQSAR